MAYTRFILSAALAGLIGATLPAAAQSVEEQVTKAYAAWDAAFNSGDAAAVADTYTKDAIFLPATHDVITGPEGVADFFGSLFEMGVTGHKSSSSRCATRATPWSALRTGRPPVRTPRAQTSPGAASPPPSSRDRTTAA